MIVYQKNILKKLFIVEVPYLLDKFIIFTSDVYGLIKKELTFNSKPEYYKNSVVDMKKII